MELMESKMQDQLEGSMHQELELQESPMQREYSRRLTLNLMLLRSWHNIAQLRVIQLNPIHKSLEADFEKLKADTAQLMKDWGMTP